MRAPQAKLPCDVTDENFAAGLVMYGSYAVLFLAFAVGKYCKAKAPAGGEAAPGKAAPRKTKAQ